MQGQWGSTPAAPRHSCAALGAPKIHTHPTNTPPGQPQAPYPNLWSFSSHPAPTRAAPEPAGVTEPPVPSTSCAGSPAASKARPGGENNVPLCELPQQGHVLSPASLPPPWHISSPPMREKLLLIKTGGLLLIDFWVPVDKKPLDGCRAGPEGRSVQGTWAGCSLLETALPGGCGVWESKNPGENGVMDTRGLSLIPAPG